MYVPRILHGYRPGTSPIRTQASTSSMITGTLLPIPYGEFLSPYIDPSSEPAFADLRILGARIRCPLPTGLAPRVRVSRPTADPTTTKSNPPPPKAQGRRAEAVSVSSTPAKRIVAWCFECRGSVADRTRIRPGRSGQTAIHRYHARIDRN